MVTSLSELLPLVVPKAPGAGEAEILAALREANREFCSRTGLWRTTVSGIDVVEDQAAYALTLPSGADAFQILLASWNGVPLGAGTYRLQATSSGHEFVFEDAYIPTADEVGVLEVEVELKPAMHSNVASVEILTQHAHVLAARAIELLTGNRRSPAYNPEVADEAHWAWVSGLTGGQHARHTGRVRGSIQVQGRSWL